MKNVLLVEGTVSQLDFIADMVGNTCEMIYADTWLPNRAEYEGDVQALVQLRFENGSAPNAARRRSYLTTTN